jgi:predicted phosphoribosyltransferase
MTEIRFERETDSVAGITPSGTVAYNKHYSQGEIDELASEYYGYIEQEKLNQMHEMNRLLGSGGTISKDLLRSHNVILVSDGLKTGFPIDLAYEFLKTIAIEKLIVATPFASIQAVDRMHLIADDLYCLSVLPEYSDTNHYYDKQDIPDHATVVETIEKIILEWK